MFNAHHKIAQTLKISDRQVSSTLKLLEEGGTIPFIARYRKEMTGGLDEVQIAGIRDLHQQIIDFDKRKEAIVKSLTELGVLDDNLKLALDKAENINSLEDIYLPYKPKRKTRASIAKEKGLEPLALLILEQKQGEVDAVAATFIDEEKGVKSIEDALSGAQDIISEIINEHAPSRELLRKLYMTEGQYVSSVLKDKEAEGIKYKDYFQWTERINAAPSHRVLAMRRGENEGILRLSLQIPEEKAISILERAFITANNSKSVIVKKAIEDGFKRLLKPAIETEIRNLSKISADIEAIKVFSENAKQLLLEAPLGEKRVMAIDPGFRTGCKVVCLNEQGKLLDYIAIFPHTGESGLIKAKTDILGLVQKYKIEAIAIGNGTAGRETEIFIKGLNLEGVLIVMVNESGASIYSASAVAREEFPDHDVTVRGAVSIGRRLMDPLAELVKIDPKSIGVGQYQHDVDQQKLQQSLDDAVMSCVNSVGVELNTASKQVLAYVAGLGPSLAQNIINYRNKNGAFKNRESLKNVPRLGDKAFEQAAGFLRIRNAENVLDTSGVHPERYSLVQSICKDVGATVKDLMTSKELRDKIDLKKYISNEIGMPTLKDIMDELAKPGRDPRAKFETFEFAEGVNSISDLKIGMKLPGRITNITAFGAFADIGVHQDGLIHTSQLSNKFVSNPNEVVKVNQVVEVTVLEVDIQRKRISLTMKTEGNANNKLNNIKPKDNTSKNIPKFKARLSKSEPKNADGDLQEKLAQLKDLFKK